jgi:hypothetical protein
MCATCVNARYAVAALGTVTTAIAGSTPEQARLTTKRASTTLIDA